ncbi:MAG: ankyrin repeat domain-containing protein, partial [Methylophilus sp.]
DIDHEDSEGTPLLHLAVSNNSPDMAELLIKHGADVKTRDQYGLTAYVYALKSQNPAMVELIKAAGGKY